MLSWSSSIQLHCKVTWHHCCICLYSHLIRHPGAVCEFVPISDSDDHRWLQEKWVTALREKTVTFSHETQVQASTDINYSH